MTTLILTLSPATSKSLAWLLAMLFIDYFAVIAAVMVDFRSGTLRAKREGRPRTSRGYRRTVEKLSRYLVTLLALTVVDAMIVGAAMLLRSTMEWQIPVFPLFSTIGAIALALIEGKSVMENSQKTTDFTHAASQAADFLSQKEFLQLLDAIKNLKKDKSNT